MAWCPASGWGQALAWPTGVQLAEATSSGLGGKRGLVMAAHPAAPE